MNEATYNVSNEPLAWMLESGPLAHDFTPRRMTPCTCAVTRSPFAVETSREPTTAQADGGCC